MHNLSVTALLAMFGVTAAGAAEPDRYFRHDGGVATHDALPLPERLDDSTRLWRQKTLPGNSTPCVHGDAVYLTTYDKSSQELALAALDRLTGEIQWRRAAPTERIEPYHPVGSPASSSPACDGERVYVFFGSYGLLCYDLDGVLQWSQPMGPFQDEFGASSSPILVDGKVILNEDHDLNNFLIALDARTGETLWKTPREEFTRSYSTPIVWDDGARKQIVVAGSLKLVAYDIATGRELWWVNGLSRIVDTSPVVAAGRLYVATWTPGGDDADRITLEPFPRALALHDKNDDGLIAEAELPEGAVLQRFFRMDLNQDKKLDESEWNKHAQVFAQAKNVALSVRPGGEGDVTETHVDWVYQRGLPTVPSPLVYRGVLYMVKDGGVITSLDAATGELLKQGRAGGVGNYYASPVAGDGKVYIAGERGLMTVLKADGDWEILSTHDFGERIMATPVIADGQIYVRTDEELSCFVQQ